MNRSKISGTDSIRFWRKWSASGAVESGKKNRHREDGTCEIFVHATFPSYKRMRAKYTRGAVYSNKTVNLTHLQEFNGAGVWKKLETTRESDHWISRRRLFWNAEIPLVGAERKTQAILEWVHSLDSWRPATLEEMLAYHDTFPELRERTVGLGSYFNFFVRGRRDFKGFVDYSAYRYFPEILTVRLRETGVEQRSICIVYEDDLDRRWYSDRKILLVKK